MKMVYLVSSKSKDQSTKIGAVTVSDKQILSTGFNGICRGVVDEPEDRNVAPTKYVYFEHAERNACYSAAREGIKLKGSTMYTQDIPCADCCRGVIQSGIKKIVIHDPWSKIWKDIQGNQWVESQNHSKQMLEECGIEVISMQQQVGIETLIKGGIYGV